MTYWEQWYSLFGITDFIYFISSPKIQEELFPIKLVFIFFTIFFLGAVIWFYMNSSYLTYKFSQDVTEFLSWQAYGLKEVNKRWKKIMKRMETDLEPEYKIAVIEADDLLYQMLDERGYEGETFEELAKNASKKMSVNVEDILEAHTVRNSIVYNPDFKLDAETARKMLLNYENAIKNIAVA
ncbi:MAG: hypothetical protein A3A98_01715 [Candidatus Staskawiczbacteria bacterium RIFCSPLOWO2_01_FULL_40_39]|uniref:DUF4129 domain-containing protein n=1 Tax=Candidatus Staskawiczbacteria bacterium RIFCSPHIGHO2_01_FULL_39_25 TaxID=1802202 RepID=A0A1G2HQ75_9BACT|nr:MAG: hypothetical protein A2730_01870 [Candidatus Staskawiczbacteria bacterium RIFCSPHIGHO2_01_FULL_39_25]OGZ72690.1 MAG: hypothetical protein A3A98_01715 [Candidatus Staskawiczbacteria bacterium RIFCSPLOWO2_01_FULL_40_39]OGZ75554.1 MAG: hypothetical protein A3I87_02695 [Candidatus Staskawiczbacteria bacterium RIFCSPLOWO2_02_FULL_39_8]